MIHSGKQGKSFYIKFDDVSWVKRKSILRSEKGVLVEVVKVYHVTWWRKLLLKLGFKVKLLQVKVKTKTND